MNGSKCKNLDIKDKKAGKVKGAKYWCKARRCYVMADDCTCEKYVEDKKRKKDDIKKVYSDGKEFDDMNVSPFTVFLIIIILIIIGSFMGVFKIG